MIAKDLLIINRSIIIEKKKIVQFLSIDYESFINFVFVLSFFISYNLSYNFIIFNNNNKKKKNLN